MALLLLLAALPPPTGAHAAPAARLLLRTPRVGRMIPSVRASASPPPPEPLSPQDALRELAPLFDQLRLIYAEGSSWDAEERAERRRAIVRSYVRVFAPALAFSAAQLLLSALAFAAALLSLRLSGRGYADVAAAAAAWPLVGDAVGRLDPAWGDAALALLGVELAAPLLLPAAAAATPAMAAALQRQLEAWGLDAEGLNARIEKVLKDTSG
ncbi:hypothetical protein AB1Y20_011865 [Prymnesium parvum]|uniref:Uncharacterized protein n=1 Tax=Prymnesium parvum TaxID=97485 RepID=A0AB34II85_PRYPA